MSRNSDRSCSTTPSGQEGKRIRAAAALIALDSPGTPATGAWSELRIAENPDARVELLEWLVQSKVDPEVLMSQLEIERDPSLRLIVIQCLADRYGEQPSEMTPAYFSRLLTLYREDPDSGVHSSIAYLACCWGHSDKVKAIDLELAGKPRETKRWYVNSQGQTMAVVGSDSDLTSLLPGRRRLRYTFAIATTETTLGQFLEFRAGHRAMREAHTNMPQPNADTPVDVVSYNDAALYCNWLSMKEGIPEKEWCYVSPNSGGPMLMVSDYLSRTGYRLPNLEEWEYAAHAGTTTDRYFGNSLAHAAAFTWFKPNTAFHAEPVGQKRPNDFGLFDVIGNLFEWCYNPSPPHNNDCACGAAREGLPG